MSKYKIVLDVMGSDSGPETMLRGAALALKKHPDLTLVLVGDEAVIQAACKTEHLDESRVEILPAPDVISNEDASASAVFQKRDSSLVKALTYTMSDDSVVGLVNAGNTGALIAGAARYLLSETRERPVLAASLPKESGGYLCLCDTGATIDCTPAMLLHFAKLGTEFMRKMYKIEFPRVALLSNGAEDTKGNKLVKEAFPLLRDCEDINFIGNVEGSNALSGVCDVVVCDGFAGNQVLKVTEGTARRLITDIAGIAQKTGKAEYVSLVKELKAKYDFNSLGGAIILGSAKPVIKAHGRANEQTVLNSISMLVNFATDKTVYESIID